MRLHGWMLWGQNAQWVQGTWSVEGGIIRSVPEGQGNTCADFTGFFTPGFADVHCHIGIGPDGPVDIDVQKAQMEAQLSSGVLLVRDCGVPVDNSQVRLHSSVPVLIRCGQHIARVKRYIRGLPREIEPADLPEVMAQEARRGDGWVKIVGDWIDRSQGAQADLAPLWPREALIDGVAAAHEAGARVAVHAFSHTVIDDLLEAGVDDIEHGSGMDAVQLQCAKERGIAVTPTLQQVELFADFAAQAGRKYPMYAATMQAMYDTRVAHAQMLFDSGVQILSGTDSGGYQEHGCIGDELRLWLAAGLRPERILDYATWGTRSYLGFSSLDEGKSADMVFFREDPRENPSVWGKPDVVFSAGVPVYCRDS
ncbi:amidohydrolase family protein [Schaalia sp. lx-100]|uniref:amidohydrolase family protein n=1 Tax=Schaalia sp. lx-100 TaxID=2899081 RepID=UPI001E5B01B5|nr:amidohydrolase family protein [Schaalia sp. lx-100]MCD4557113.1 amidohydrolase family protein [Schaalia sp. lx-100]